MKPNLENAAVKANETISRYNIQIESTDPLAVLKQLKNVYLVSHDAPVTNGANQDAVTLVNKTKDGLQYIVIYNSAIDADRLHFALARELGHIILRHDGSSPEDIWAAEADCFAYHFLCPAPIIMRKKPINYRPVRISLSWEMKDMLVFDSIDEMKSHIVEEQNKFNRFVGKGETFGADDVEIKSVGHDKRIGWKNCCEIVMNGRTVGYCGE